MDALEKNQTYLFHLVGYEVEGDKIIETYEDGTILDDIPNIPHNIESCERKLLRQFEKTKEEQTESFNRCLKGGGLSIAVFTFTGILALFDEAYAAAISSAYFIGNTIFHMKKSMNGILRLRLTDYCLTHAASLKFSENEKDASYGLSEKGKKAFRLDHGFKLNHAHLYTNKDLKQLKKVVGR